MTVLFKLCGCALIAAICTLALKGSAKNAAICVAAFASLMILGTVVGRFSGAFETVSEIMKESGAPSYGTLMLKALGVGIVVNTVGGICRDMGESSLSSGIELAGKVEILLLCLPVITDMLSLIKGLLL